MELQELDFDHDYPQGCYYRCNEKLKKMMINPYQSKKVKYFHALLSLTLYFDIILTSLCMGSYEFQTIDGNDLLQNHKVYTGIIII